MGSRIASSWIARALIAAATIAGIYREVGLFLPLPGAGPAAGASILASAFERPRDQRGDPGFVPVRAFFLQIGSRLPEDARVFIAIGEPALYFFGTYLLFPREVLASDPGVVLNDETDLATHSLRPPAEWLRAHRIDAVVVYNQAGEVTVVLREGRW